MAFRIDYKRADWTPADEVFGHLVAYADDASVPGYPYPLLAAHNQIRLTPAEITELRYMLQNRAIVEGLSQGDWELLFSDFHEALDAEL